MLFVAIMVTGICFNAEAMTLLFTLITGMTLWEFCGLVNDDGRASVNRFITTAAGVYLYLAFAGFCSGITPSAVFIPYLLTIIYLFISELYLKQENPINNWAYTMLAQMYIALPFSMINVLAFQADPATGEVGYQWMIPMAIFVFLWTNDTGAYCTGSLIGKHKLFPSISPGKTWEGSAGGAVLVVIVAIIISLLTASVEGTGGYAYWIGMGLVVVVFGTWGDLVESLFKRKLGIKDSGNILPGHGGMLDRFDSSLMALPAVVIYLYSLSFL